MEDTFVRLSLKEKEIVCGGEREREPGVDGISKPLLMIKETLRCLRCKVEYLLAFVLFVFFA